MASSIVKEDSLNAVEKMEEEQKEDFQTIFWVQGLNEICEKSSLLHYLLLYLEDLDNPKDMAVFQMVAKKYKCCFKKEFEMIVENKKASRQSKNFLDNSWNKFKFKQKNLPFLGQPANDFRANGIFLQNDAKRFEIDSLLERIDRMASFMKERINETVQSTIYKGKEFFKTEQPLYMTGGTLLPYQIRGINWLDKMNFNGCHAILADDVGLGKITQIIGFIARCKSNYKISKTYIIIAPLSRLRHWKNEFHRWCPRIKSLLYHGNKNEREMLRMNGLKNHIEIRNTINRRTGKEVSYTVYKDDFPIIITSYAIAMRDINHLNGFRSGFLVFDEGQQAKNVDRPLMRQLWELKKFNAHTKILLSRRTSLLSNNIFDLWSLLNLTRPDMACLQPLFDRHIEKLFLPYQKDKIRNILNKCGILRRMHEDVVHEFPEDSGMQRRRLTKLSRLDARKKAEDEKEKRKEKKARYYRELAIANNWYICCAIAILLILIIHF